MQIFAQKIADLSKAMELHFGGSIAFFCFAIFWAKICRNLKKAKNMQKIARSAG
jgi:hypothetical protein